MWGKLLLALPDAVVAQLVLGVDEAVQDLESVHRDPGRLDGGHAADLDAGPTGPSRRAHASSSRRSCRASVRWPSLAHRSPASSSTDRARSGLSRYRM